ncbi:MAG TPA: DUF3857 domain-containing protein [Candidatus Sulfotelmatobacter sp.]|jgi:tetratricopeptide (TPR) repeat protein/transglutaminase-like putative cysteine protease
MSSKNALAVLLIAACAIPFAFGQVKADEKPSSAATDFSKEAYVIDRLRTAIIEEADGSGSREHSAEVKILADAGVKAFAVLNFTYSSANEVVDVDYVRVRKPDGTVVKTPDYNIQDLPADVTRTAPLYSDIHEKHVAVKGLGVGDVLEYLVRFRVVKPEVPGQFWYEHNFNKNAIVKDEKLELSVPAEKYVKVVSPDFKPEVKDAGGRRIYSWTHSNLEVKEKDPNEIPRRIPPNPSVQVTTFKSWEEVGGWYGGLQKEPLEVTSAIQAKAAELTKGLRSDDEKIRAIYAFVSLQFHYIGLDFGIGRYQPHAADDVLGNGYGDCKDKHTLLASLLKAAGIDAWPALIHATRKLDPEVPSPAQFNHVITVIPSGGKFIWLDTTPEVAPYELLISVLRDKQALVIPTNQAPLLMTTPQNPPFPMEQEFTSSGKLDGNGTYTGHITQSYRGDTEVLLRAAFRQLSESQWKDAVQRFSYALNFGGDVSNVKVSPPNELDKPFQISYDYLRKNFGDWDDRNTSAALPMMGLEVSKDSKVRKPQEPLLLGMPGKIVYRSQMELPPGYSVAPRPRSHEVESFAQYTADTTVENGVLRISRELIVKNSEVPLSDWETYRRFGRAVSDDELALMPVKSSGGFGTTAKNAGSAKDNTEEAGDVDENFRRATDALRRRDNQHAQELLEKVVAAQPKYKGAHFELGVVLVSLNKVSEALAEFHKEQEIAPDDVRAYQAPAFFLNATGHKEDAIQEWRKLLKADPESHDAAVNLGQLLYQTKKYPEAAEMLETALKGSPENPGVQSELGQAYLKAGQTEKGVTHLKAAAEEKGDPAMLNDVAYTLAENKVELALAQQYAEKAVKSLDEQMQTAEAAHDLRASFQDQGLRVTYQLSLTWDTLGWVYFQQGDAKRAEPFIRAAWLLGEEAIVGQHLGEIYEKESKTQQAAQEYLFALTVSHLPPSGPQSAYPGFSPPNGDLTQYHELTARYKKLTGKDPALIDIHRLPNGEWTKTPAEQLRHTREVKLPNTEKLAGAAQFIVTFRPETVESAEFSSGDDDLEPLADKLKVAHYPLEFPPSSGAILVMRVDVSCHSDSACIGTLVVPVPVPQPSHAPLYTVPN